jgi:flagellar protein FliO/FliZ
MGSGDASTAELGIRLLGSLAVVVGLLVLLARLVNRRFKAPAGAAVQVVCRQSLTRSSGVAVVTVGTRVLVLGTTEQQVTLLAEVEPEEVGLDEVELAEDGAEGSRARRDGRFATSSTTGGRRVATSSTTGTGALAGSILSPQTWKQTFAAFGSRDGRLGTSSTTGATDESAPDREAS